MSAKDLVIDLRSDTVTRPTPEMRRAIAEAVVGDDVFGDDPTVQELERRIAELTGKDAAVYVPSGTMGNQLAIASLARPGEEALLDIESHIFLYEQGGIAANAGVLAHPLASERGVLDPATIHAAIRDEDADEHVAKMRLLCLENTQNRHGGAIVPLERLRAAVEAARAHGLLVHLDGARLWNASVATGIPVREWVRPVDTVMMCFSKGLGAPVGSILAGPESVIHSARRLRKRWGGAMRQVGILAAACLYAIDHHIERLADDHRRATRLAEGLRSIPGIRVNAPQTNIVLVTLEHPALAAEAMERALATCGVRVITFGARRLRAITHLDVDDRAIDGAIEAFHAVISDRIGAPAR